MEISIFMDFVTIEAEFEAELKAKDDVIKTIQEKKERLKNSRQKKCLTRTT